MEWCLTMLSADALRLLQMVRWLSPYPPLRVALWVRSCPPPYQSRMPSFALLGYSFLPYQAYLTDARAAAAAPDVFRPLRGSLIFMMRPFYPPRLGRSVKKPS